MAAAAGDVNLYLLYVFAVILLAYLLGAVADLVAAFNAAATDPYPVSIAVGPAGAWCSRVTVTGTATSRKQTARLTAL